MEKEEFFNGMRVSLIYPDDDDVPLNVEGKVFSIPENDNYLFIADERNGVFHDAHEPPRTHVMRINSEFSSHRDFYGRCWWVDLEHLTNIEPKIIDLDLDDDECI